MLKIDERQKQHLQDVLDPVVHEKAFLWIAQGDCDGAIPEEILCYRCQQSGDIAFSRRNHIRIRSHQKVHLSVHTCMCKHFVK